MLFYYRVNSYISHNDLASLQEQCNATEYTQLVGNSPGLTLVVNLRMYTAQKYIAVSLHVAIYSNLCICRDHSTVDLSCDNGKYKYI